MKNDVNEIIRSKLSFMKISEIFLMVAVLFLLTGCKGKPADPVDKIFVNGHIITMDDENPVVESIAVGAGKFLAAGKTTEIMKLFPETEVIDLQGKTVMPGIIESHGHLLSLGQSFLDLNVEGAAMPEEVVQAVAKRVEKMSPGEWITGWGWDEGAWAKHYPNKDKLSQVSPANPVFLSGLHGFAGWANQKALEIAGISHNSPPLKNGEILKDPQTGEPTGILTNEAQELVTRHIPPLSQDRMQEALTLAIDECLKFGLTSVHEARTTKRMLEALRVLKARKELKARIYVMLDWTDEDLLEPYFMNGPIIDPEHMLTIRCIKVFVDGALGSRGAAFLEPYSDAPAERGLVVTPEERLFQLTQQALLAGMQVAVHAIGDRANRITLNAFQKALEAFPEVGDHRLRLEHAQVVAWEDIPHFAPLDIVLSMQPPHAVSDMSWAETRIGPERIRGAYAWRSFLDTGVHLTLNSDFPGEDLNPFYGMYAAMTRQNAEGEPEGGWFPEQCLTRKEVLKAYTVEAAYSAFEENIKGKIVPGMLADFIILSDDILTIPVDAFLSLFVEKAYVGGHPVLKIE